MARILCIEDSTEFQIYLTSVLSSHSLTHAASIREAMRLIENGFDKFDLILLDVSLPDGNGMKALPEIKSYFADRIVPIVVISVDNDTLTKVAAFGIGADDYISKPPDANELKARVEAKLRLVGEHTHQSATVTLGDITIDTEKMLVQQNINGTIRPIDLTPLEFKILRILAQRPGQVFSREHLIDRAWGVGRHITARTVDAHISHLRQKLSNGSLKIETVLSSGYKIILKPPCNRKD